MEPGNTALLPRSHCCWGHDGTEHPRSPGWGTVVASRHMLPQGLMSQLIIASSILLPRKSVTWKRVKNISC